MGVDAVPALVRRLYQIVTELESLFPGRKFTPDGHLVGSIGEVLAAHHYGLELLPASAETHDAIARDGRQVQVKATQVRKIGISSEPEVLLVLGLKRDGSFREIYNGSGRRAWEAAGRMQKTGQRHISVSRLEALMKSVPVGERVALVHGTGS